MTSSGVLLNSGDTITAHMTYDGANLVMTLTDIVVNKTFTHTFPDQYSRHPRQQPRIYRLYRRLMLKLQPEDSFLDADSRSPPTVWHAPFRHFSPRRSGHLYLGPVESLCRQQPECNRSTTLPTGQRPPPPLRSIVPPSPSAPTHPAGYRGGSLSQSPGRSCVCDSSQRARTINFAAGFPNATGLQLNGRPHKSSKRLELTNGATTQLSSAFWTTPVNIQAFITNFTFQLTSAAGRIHLHHSECRHYCPGGSAEAGYGPDYGADRHYCQERRHQIRSLQQQWRRQRLHGYLYQRGNSHVPGSGSHIPGSLSERRHDRPPNSSTMARR